MLLLLGSDKKNLLSGEIDFGIDVILMEYLCCMP
jgi:hypothetical protein